MRKCIETGLAVVSAHPTGSHAAEGHTRSSQMNDRIVDTSAAKAQTILQEAFIFPALSENVTRKWFWPAGYLTDNLI